MGYKWLSENLIGQDLKNFSDQQLEELCGEIRSFLIEHVSKTGGHLSSNLGTVELTVALFHAFDFRQDIIVWDVGHQSYTYKLLTGRMAQFDMLRKKGGISGFPSPHETPYDAFIAGHGSVSISAAVGIATAKKLRGEPGHVIAVMGDGAFTGGMIYEGLNNISSTLDNLIIILNDNKMSISKNVGAMSRYLTGLRNSTSYSHAKRTVEDVLAKTPLIGRPLHDTIVSVKTFLRQNIYNSTFFEDLGLQYIGKTNGNDIAALASLLRNIRLRPGPMILHLETTKGKGYQPAEENPGAFHGVSSFDYQHIPDPDNAPSDSFSNVFGEELTALGQRDSRVCAITAAMKYGTGLQFFYKAHKDRFFDVGMAEQHAVTFAAGLATQGMRPVFAVYSTFLQRAYDQLIHDVLLQRADVLFAIDRAGLVPGDGETHQGIYDVAFLSQFQDFPVFSPCNYAELRYWLGQLMETYNGPRAIRYPRGGEDTALSAIPCTGRLYDKLIAGDGIAALVTYGRLTKEALTACQMASEQGVQPSLYKLTAVHPLPAGLVESLLKYRCILFAEDGLVQGGVGQQLGYALYKAGYRGCYNVVGVTAHNIDHCTVDELYKDFELDSAALAQKLCQETAKEREHHAT